MNRIMSFRATLRLLLASGLIFLSLSKNYASSFRTPIHGAQQLATQSTLTIYRNADSAVNNPAAMSLMSEGWYLSAGAFFTQAKFQWSDAVVREETVFSESGSAIGRMAQESYGSAKTQNNVSIYPTFQIVRTQGKLGLGFALKYPFTNTIKWEDNWEGRRVVEENKIMTVALNPSLSYLITKNHAFAISYSLIRAGFFNKQAPPDGSDADTIIDLNGTSHRLEVSYIGLIKRFALAIRYSSPVTLRLFGETDFRASGGDLQETKTTTTTSARFALPWENEISLGWKNDSVHPTFELEFGIVYTAWRTFQQIDLRFDDNLPIFEDRLVIRKHYRDTLSFKVGMNYHVTDKFIYMTGVSVGLDPTREKYVSPMVPIGQKNTYGMGVEFSFSGKKKLGFAYALTIFSPLERDDELDLTYEFYDEPFITGSYAGVANSVALTYHSQF